LRLRPFVGKIARVERRRHSRKLLIASIGVAAVSYVACGGDDASPSGTDAGMGGAAGSAVSDAGAPPSTMDAIAERSLPGFDVLVANLMVSPMTKP
jgi:hypothetical protein